MPLDPPVRKTRFPEKYDMGASERAASNRPPSGSGQHGVLAVALRSRILRRPALSLSALPLALAACHDPGDGKGDVCEAAWTTDARDPASPLSIEHTRFGESPGSGRLLGARPIRLGVPDGDAATAVTVTLAADDPDAFTLLGADGAPFALPVTLTELPRTVYVEAAASTAAPIATLTATIADAAAGCEPAVLALVSVPVARLTGRSRAEAPGFGYDDVFGVGEPIEVALDPAAQPDGIAGSPGVWWTPHRTVADWSTGPTLTSVSSVTLPVTFDAATLEDAGRIGWEAAEVPPDQLGDTLDLVLDLDGDGTFSPGDRLDQGVYDDGVRIVGDFGAVGPHPVSQEDVSGGDWLGERVYWPDDLAELGPRPLVVFSHGNGHDYTWYDYLGTHLASWGYVVMTHQNETQPGIETASTTTLTNTDWFLSNLDTVGDGALVGLVDDTRIAWIGHSRGGEGVVRAYTRLREGAFVPDGYDAEDIRVITSIAPTVFNEVDVSNPYDVRYHLLAGTADGDVTGGPEQPATQSFRLYQAATGTKSSTVIYGASHEDFDCCGRKEGDGPDQLEREVVQVLAQAYLLTVVADGLDADPYARAILSHDPLHLPATPLPGILVSTWRPAEGAIIDDFQDNVALDRASTGAAVTYDVDNVHEGLEDDADRQLTWTGDDPMNGMTQAAGARDEAAGVVFDWTAARMYRYELPSELRDWSGESYLAFNGCQGTRHPLTDELAGPLDLSVTLTDGAGVSVTRSTAPVTSIATPYLRGRAGTGKGWSNVYSTVRLPLVDYTAGGTGLDLADIRAVQFDFGADGDAPIGRLGLDDVEVEPW